MGLWIGRGAMNLVSARLGRLPRPQNRRLVDTPFAEHHVNSKETGCGKLCQVASSSTSSMPLSTAGCAAPSIGASSINNL